MFKRVISIGQGRIYSLRKIIKRNYMQIAVMNFLFTYSIVLLTGNFPTKLNLSDPR